MKEKKKLNMIFYIVRWMVHIKRNREGEETDLEQGKIIYNFAHLPPMWLNRVQHTMTSAKILQMYRFLFGGVFILLLCLYKYIVNIILYKILYNE